MNIFIVSMKLSLLSFTINSYEISKAVIFFHSKTFSFCCDYLDIFAKFSVWNKFLQYRFQQCQLNNFQDVFRDSTADVLRRQQEKEVIWL